MPNASESFRLLRIKWWDARFPDIVDTVVDWPTWQFFAIGRALSAAIP